MIVSRSIRQQRRAAQDAVKAIQTGTCLMQRRHVSQGHSLPLLDYNKTFSRRGVQKMLSAKGYQSAWHDYQGMLLNKVNSMTAETADAHALTKTLAIKYSRSASHASLFNHASMAHNNHFFFSHLTPHFTTPSPTFLSHIEASFSSLSSFRRTFLATAQAPFGPAFTWLVRRTKPQPTGGIFSSSGLTPDLAILTTYIAGSPYPGAHFRKQPTDMATQPGPIGSDQTPQGMALAQAEARRSSNPNTQLNSVGAFGASSLAGQMKTAPGGQDLEVLLCVNTWEHVWLPDHGIEGKARYLERWWDCVDWDKVEGTWSEARMKDDGGKGGMRGRGMRDFY